MRVKNYTVEQKVEGYAKLLQVGQIVTSGSYRFMHISYGNHQLAVLSSTVDL
jgi:hypothetical protein